MLEESKKIQMDSIRGVSFSPFRRVRLAIWEARVLLSMVAIGGLGAWGHGSLTRKSNTLFDLRKVYPT